MDQRLTGYWERYYSNRPQREITDVGNPLAGHRQGAQREHPAALLKPDAAQFERMEILEIRLGARYAIVFGAHQRRVPRGRHFGLHAAASKPRALG